MQLFCVQADPKAIGIAAAALGIFAMGILSGAPARAEGTLADRVNEVSNRTQPATGEIIQSTDYQPMFHLDYPRRATARDCQVPLPPIGAVSPFPIALRLGALISPRTKFVGGIDATIPGLHLFPGFSSRVDADAIISANFGGVSTLVPVTFDQIYNLNLPVNSRVYLGVGVGPYFGNKIRFGGKLIAGAEFNRFGLEGNIHFAGIGDPLFTVQARIGL